MAKIIVANKERFECTKWYTRKIVKRLHVSEIKFKKIKVDYPKFYEKRSHRYQKHAMPTQDPHNIPELSIYTIFHLVNDHFLFAHSQKKSRNRSSIIAYTIAGLHSSRNNLQNQSICKQIDVDQLPAIKMLYHHHHYPYKYQTIGKHKIK